MNDNCNHCWHHTGVVLTSYPPQHPELCCHCGEQRIRSQPKYEKEIGHGKYAPHQSFTFTTTQLNNY